MAANTGMTELRTGARNRTFIRMWRVLLLLRCAPQTVPALAKALSVSTRTIRRDLAALQAVPLPITSRFEADRHGIRRCEPNVWCFGETPAWPRNEVAPIAQLEEWGSDAVRS